jgi:thiosulfate dehydrogenase
VNSLARPSKDLSKDWPNISKKAVDHPFGPFSDSFSENSTNLDKPIKNKTRKTRRNNFSI